MWLDPEHMCSSQRRKFKGKASFLGQVDDISHSFDSQTSHLRFLEGSTSLTYGTGYFYPQMHFFSEGKLQR
jgi:hypothetical protein